MISLEGKLRAVADEDRGNLLTVSYSKLDLFGNCERRYQKTYKEKKFTSSATLPLELGSILHKGLEMKALSLMKGEPVDYENITSVVTNGCDEETEKNKNHHIFGISEIKERHSAAWLESLEDTENKSYDEKINLYLSNILTSRMEDKEWKVKGAEIPFEFVYDNRCIVHGFIDRVDYKVDENGKEILKVIDYKSSKKVFPDNKIKTPLQMVIYDLACYHLYGVIPTEHEYDFILLDKKQTSAEGVCSKGYLTRGIKKIDSVLDKIDEAEEENEYPPSPTPLCYWCPYVSKLQSPNADPEYGGECQYYSLWRPENKTFGVNVEYIPGEEAPEERKLVF